MRSSGPNSPAVGAANVIVLGVDARTMGTIRETLGTEAVLPAAPTSFEDAMAVIAKTRPDVVIGGFDRDFDEAIRITSQIGTKFPRIQLITLASKTNPNKIRAAMRAGYREFVVLPDDADLLRQAVHEANFRGDPDSENGDVVALWGSKGGVGTTFLAVNLAAELAPVNRVCVVDLQFAMGDAAVMLDLQPQQ